MDKSKKLMLNIQATGRKPTAEQERGRPRLALAIVVLLAVIAGLFWLARDPKFRESATEKVQTLTSSLSGAGSVLENVTAAAKNLLGGTPAVPPVGSSGKGIPGAPVPGQPGAGGIEGAAEVKGTSSGVPGEGTAGLDSAALNAEGGVTERGTLDGVLSPEEPVPGRQDDAVVKVAFIEDLAQWLVDGYQPAGSKSGSLTVGVQSANLRYGAGMRGLSWIGDDLPKGRAEAIRYVFTPDMLSALYKLYIDRFMHEMALAVDKAAPGGKELTPGQKTDIYRTYAKRFRGLSGALQSVGALPDFARRMDGVKAASQHVVEANAKYSELVFAQDEARELNQTAKANALAPKVSAAGQVYQQAVIAREKSLEGFSALLRQNPSARLLDDDTLLFVAFWVDRRVRNDPEHAAEATLQAATLFLDLAQRFEQAAGVIS